MVGFEERVICGGKPDQYLTVRHAVMKGSQFEIGQWMVELAKKYFAHTNFPSEDPLTIELQRGFMREHWLAHYERMRGAAHAAGQTFEDNGTNFTRLYCDYGSPGCSNVYFPCNKTIDGHAYLSRNFDFAISDEPVSSRQPFLLESYPDVGIPSLFICLYDLLGAALDGMNAEGLGVALLMDYETNFKNNVTEPLLDGGIGLAPLNIVRFLLETCSTADDAKKALLTTQQHLPDGSLHYIIGDRHGNGFVWEGYAFERAADKITERKEEALAVTNHLLGPAETLSTDDVKESQYRLDRLQTEIVRHGGPFTRDDIRRINQCVSASVIAKDAVPARTLWYSLYDLEDLTLDIDFYVKDGAPLTGENRGFRDAELCNIERSQPMRFRLAG